MNKSSQLLKLLEVEDDGKVVDVEDDNHVGDPKKIMKAGRMHEADEHQVTIHLENKHQATLLRHELLGQISDGNWENAKPSDHWEPWIDAKIEVDGKLGLTGPKWILKKRNYNFTSLELLSIVMPRMISQLALVDKGVPDEDIDTLDGYASTVAGLENMEKTNSHFKDKVSPLIFKYFKTYQEFLDVVQKTHWTPNAVKKELQGIKKAFKTDLD